MIQTFLPPAKIGIIGGGQLGKMLVREASRLGYDTRVWSNKADDCALRVATERLVGPYTNKSLAAQFVDGIAVATLEFENIPPSLCEDVYNISGNKVRLFPGKRALEVSQDRRKEKAMARALGIKTPEYAVIEIPEDLRTVEIFPVILKTATLGYDGKGQRHVNDKRELESAWNELGRVPCVAEQVVDFTEEFSVITVRSQESQCVTYEPFDNMHDGGILVRTVWPSEIADPDLCEQAQRATEKIARELGVVGLLTVEWFYVEKTNEIIFNEIAPRPHNSGHVTIDFAETSQFEQHIRAICGLPLGSPEVRDTGGIMTNVIGTHDALIKALDIPGAFVHNYGKSAAPGRKLGHITVEQTEDYD